MNAQSLRSDFPILDQLVHDEHPLVYLDNAASTQRPQQVIDAVAEVYRVNYSNVHRGIHWLSEKCTDAYEDSRRVVQQLIGAAHDHEIIFTSGTTAGINLVARSWGDEFVGSEDEVLLTEMEHHSNIVPWQQLSQRTGCRLRYLPITDDGELDLQQAPSFFNERTRIVAFTAVSNVLGTVNPVEMLVNEAHRVGAVAVVDAAQHVPHQRIDVQQSDADFVTFSGHKMLGPSGVGILYGKEQLLDKMPPFLGGGSMIQRVTLDGFTPATLPSKFEAGTPPIAQAIGLAAAIKYLGEVGLEAIEKHERLLAQAAHQALESLGGIRILGPPAERKAGIVSFVVEGIHPHDTAEVLDRYGVAVRAGHHCAMPLHKRLGLAASCRASFYLYNTEQDVERLAEALVGVRKLFGSPAP